MPTGSSAPRIVLAATEGLFRDGVRSLVKTEWPLCTVVEARSTLEAAARVMRTQPDILVLDFAIPDFPQPRALRVLASKVSVAILFADDHCPDYVGVRKLGVRALINKRSDSIVFLEALRSMLGGLASTREPEHRHRLHIAGRDAVQHRSFGLTHREWQVLAEVAAAYPNKEIARRLGISEETVKKHVTAIFNKFGFSNRVELTLFASHSGLVPDSAPVQPSTPPAHLSTRTA